MLMVLVYKLVVIYRRFDFQMIVWNWLRAAHQGGSGQLSPTGKTVVVTMALPYPSRAGSDVSGVLRSYVHDDREIRIFSQGCCHTF